MEISVIIPVYNQARAIKKCLAAIFSQTFKDLEVIIVNDGSTDNLRAVLRPYETRAKIFHQTNGGAPAARNFGLAQSQGRYVIFCDADIVMKPDMLEKMYRLLERKNAFAYAYCSFKMGWKKFKLWPYDAAKLKQAPYIHSTSLMRREVCPGWDENLKKFQDWDLWLTIAEKGGLGVFIPEVLFTIKARGTMSHWLPKFFYKFGWLKTVKKYNEAKKIIFEKHGLTA
ncbi:MAG: glycosyltransferase family A protein [Candidatus Komeilibacteria bacterium]|nr:glycosyltransferase family A protein [Candidatus Komeilibacteria bacterium]